jgi:hypothetical protein
MMLPSATRPTEVEHPASTSGSRATLTKPAQLASGSTMATFTRKEVTASPTSHMAESGAGRGAKQQMSTLRAVMREKPRSLKWKTSENPEAHPCLVILAFERQVDRWNRVSTHGRVREPLVQSSGAWNFVF